MLNTFGIICAAVIIEGLVTYIKTFVADGKFQWQMVAGLALGVLVAVGYNLDILAMFDMVSTIPLLGTILTGILISRGSNYLFDLIKTIRTATESNS